MTQWSLKVDCSKCSGPRACTVHYGPSVDMYASYPKVRTRSQGYTDIDRIEVCHRRFGVSCDFQGRTGSVRREASPYLTAGRPKFAH